MNPTDIVRVDGDLLPRRTIDELSQATLGSCSREFRHDSLVASHDLAMGRPRAECELAGTLVIEPWEQVVHGA